MPVIDLRGLKAAPEVHAASPSKTTLRRVLDEAGKTGSEFLEVFGDPDRLLVGSGDGAVFVTIAGIFAYSYDGEVYGDDHPISVDAFLEALTDYYHEGEFTL